MNTLVIIPTVNEGEHLRHHCLHILALPEIHILVVDDGSRDNTREELTWLMEQTPGRVFALLRDRRQVGGFPLGSGP